MRKTHAWMTALLMAAPICALADDTALQPALQPLAAFLGTRHCSGTFLKSGKAIGATETFSAELSGYWLVMNHTDDAPNSFDAMETWGYDTDKKLFVAHVYDNFSGTREYTSPGWDGTKLVWTNVAAANGKRDRFVFEQEAKGAYRYTYELSNDDNNWTGVDSLLCSTT